MSTTELRQTIARELRTWQGSEDALADQLGTTRDIVATVRKALRRESRQNAGRPLVVEPSVEVLSTEAARQALGIGRDLLWRWIDMKVLPTTRISRQRVGVRWSSLERLVRDRATWTALDADAMADTLLARTLRRAQTDALPYRWWSMQEIADHHHYEPAAIRWWKLHHDYGAPGEWGASPKGWLYLWCDVPPEPPYASLEAARKAQLDAARAVDIAMRRERTEATLQRVVATVQALGMPRNGGNRKGEQRVTLAQIAAAVKLGESRTREYLQEARKRGLL